MTQPEGDLTAEKDFGVQVREAREAHGWTQEAVRRRLLGIFGVDLSATAFSRLEHGERPIRLNEAVALSYVLDIPMGWAGHILRTADDYEIAKQNLDLASELVREAEEELEEARRRRYDEESEAQARYISRRGEWLQMKAAILDYERRQEREQADA